MVKNKMTFTRLSASSYGLFDFTQHLLHANSLSHAEIKINCEGLMLNDKLSMLLHYNLQPNHNKKNAKATAHLHLREFELQTI